ncbi:MAG: acyltransferase [Bacteroidaceae bacterium]|nr:acyltransferase [Bacteroidaceae bacterium]
MAVAPAAAFLDTKPHYDILDGLRGVAALVVILYHVFECFDWSPAPHGYLAVDFFFVLSGFVIGYAYDNRWHSMSTMTFFRRRLIRLHPMVIMGAVLGALTFLLQGSVRWDGTHVAFRMVMVALLLNMFMLPLGPGARADVRGNGEMFPLNGPNWSLFFEYIGNILYALLLRRLPTKALAAVAVVTGALLMGVAVHDGYLGVGWSMVDGGFWSGLVRMLFPYTVGMLMARVFRPVRIRGAFWLCGAVIVLVALLPAGVTGSAPWACGVYDALCVIVVFPLLVWLGASELQVRPVTRRVSRLLGDLSYPLYAVHYPFMYLFYALIGFDGDLVPIAKLREVWPQALILPVGCILLAWLCLKFYDLPLRRRLHAPRVENR